MTCATRFSLLHGRHGGTLVFAGAVESRVAMAAISCPGQMGFVAESCRAGGLHGKNYLLCLMAEGTFLQWERFRAVMAGAAGLTRCHLRHGVLRFLPQVEDSIMAGAAVTDHATLLQMHAVVKNNSAGFSGGIHRVTYGDRRRRALKQEEDCKRGEKNTAFHLFASGASSAVSSSQPSHICLKWARGVSPRVAR